MAVENVAPRWQFKATPQTTLYACCTLIGALVIVINVLLWAPNSGSYWLAQTRQAHADELTQHNRRLMIRNAGLSAEVDSLRDGMDAVEDRARTSLGLIGQGETLYLLIDRPPTQRPANAPTR